MRLIARPVSQLVHRPGHAHGERELLDDCTGAVVRCRPERQALDAWARPLNCNTVARERLLGGDAAEVECEVGEPCETS